MRRRDGAPIWVAGDQQPGLALSRVDLASKSSSGQYNEAWLQTLLHSHPEVFPLGQIEPDYTGLIPLCRELPLVLGGNRSGALDNLLVTRDGNLGPLLDGFLANAAACLGPGGRVVWLSPFPDRTAACARRLGLKVSRFDPVDLGGFPAELQRFER